MTAPNVAMVTGGSTGIGWEICRQMLDAGYEVVSLARRRPPQSHAKLHAVEVDLIDAAATGQAAADVASRFPVAFTTIIVEFSFRYRQAGEDRRRCDAALSLSAKPGR